VASPFQGLALLPEHAAKKKRLKTGEEYGNKRKKRIFCLEIREED